MTKPQVIDIFPDRGECTGLETAIFCTEELIFCQIDLLVMKNRMYLSTRRNYILLPPFWYQSKTAGNG
jgi:hypothetical protein